MVLKCGFVIVLLQAACSPATSVTRPVDPLVRARDLTREGKPGEAYAAFERILEDQPRNLTAHRGLVEAGYYAGRLEDVAGRYRALTGRKDMQGIGHYGLGLVLVARGPGHKQEALEAFRKARELMPDEADVAYRIGLIHFMDGEYQRAADILSDGVETDPDRAGIRVAYAAALMHLGKQEQALEVLRRVLVLSPSAEEAQKARALTAKIFDPLADCPPEAAQDLRKVTDYLAQDGVQQALGLVEKVLVRNPEVAFAHTLKGLAHSRLENNGESIVAFETALKLKPRSPSALIGLGDVYARLENWAEAREYYGKAIGLDPFDLEAHQRMGDLARMRGDPDRAARSYGNLVLLAPDRIDFRHQWARALVAADQPDQAVAVYEETLRLKPDDMEALIRLGALHVALGERDPVARGRHREAARGYLKQANELNPENQAVQDMLTRLED